MKLTSPEEEYYFKEILAEQDVDISKFLQRWFGIESSSFGDGKQCNLAMARIFTVSLSTVRNWGAAPAYLCMPKSHRQRLTHLHSRMLERFS
jgi:hypothetical protein